MIRRYGKAPAPDRRHILRSGAYAILPRNRKILLTVQLTPSPNVQLPGGGIEPDESPLQALHREVREETGWAIARPQRLGAFRRFTYMPEYGIWAEKLCHIYAAHPVRPHTPPSEPDHTAVWMPQNDALLALINPGDADLLRKYYRRFRR